MYAYKYSIYLSAKLGVCFRLESTHRAKFVVSVSQEKLSPKIDSDNTHWPCRRLQNHPGALLKFRWVQATMSRSNRTPTRQRL